MKNILKLKSTVGLLLITVSMIMFGCTEPIPPDPIEIGETHQGGIVFYVDGTGEHGLVCAPLDQSFFLAWRSGPSVLTNATNTVIGQGASNTALIVSVQGSGSYAAKLCDDLVLDGYDDWFLPSRYELSEMKVTLKNLGIGNFANTGYWSSTEYDLNQAGIINFMDGGFTHHDKSEGWHVRAVRAF